MALGYVAQTDSPATLLALSAAIDACSDAQDRAKIAASLARIGGHAAMAELARLMKADANLFPDLLAAIEPNEAALLVRLIGTAVAGGQAGPQTVDFLMNKGGEAGRAFLRVAAVNHGSAPVLTALLKEGSPDSVRVLTEAVHNIGPELLEDLRKRWYTVGRAPGQWAWKQSVDTRAAKEFLRAVFEKGKSPKVQLCAAWMMTELGERPDTQRLRRNGSRPLRGRPDATRGAPLRAEWLTTGPLSFGA